MPTKNATAPSVDDLAAASARGLWSDSVQKEIDSIRELGRLSEAAFADDEIYMYADFRMQHDPDLDKALKEKDEKSEVWRRAKVKIAHELLMRAETKRKYPLQSGETPAGFDRARGMKYSEREWRDMLDDAASGNDRGGLRA